MLNTRGALDDVPFVNGPHRLSSFLIKARAFSDEQNLAPWVHVPVELCTRLVVAIAMLGSKVLSPALNSLSQMLPV